MNQGTPDEEKGPKEESFVILKRVEDANSDEKERLPKEVNQNNVIGEHSTLEVENENEAELPASVYGNSLTSSTPNPSDSMPIAENHPKIQFGNNRDIEEQSSILEQGDFFLCRFPAVILSSRALIHLKLHFIQFCLILASVAMEKDWKNDIFETGENCYVRERQHSRLKLKLDYPISKFFNAYFNTPSRQFHLKLGANDLVSFPAFNGTI